MFTGYPRIAWFVALLCLGAVGGGCQSPTGPIRVFDRIMLPDLNGEPHQPLRSSTGKPVVLVFVTTNCPIANSYAPEIQSIIADYQPRGVCFYLVHVDRSVATWDAQRHAREFGYECTVLLDTNLELVKAVGATVTPEAAVINPRRELVYRGRIDNQYVDFGKRRARPSHRDLRDALDAVLDGREIERPRTKAIGCFISHD